MTREYTEKVKQRFFAKVEKTEGCWNWTAARTIFGYGKFSVNHREIMAHRASWEMHFGEIEKGIFVCHKCDNPSCIRPDHLFLGTPTENNHDMVKKGRDVRLRGEQHPHAKLTEEIVREIKIKLKNGLSRRNLCREYGVAESTIGNIKNGNNWSHV